MSIKEVVTVNCDFCGKGVVRKSLLRVPITCLRHYEDTEGKGHLKNPQIVVRHVDICNDCAEKVINATVYGAMGYDTITIKNKHGIFEAKTTPESERLQVKDYPVSDFED